MTVPVLIVDNSSVMRAMLRKALNLSGCAEGVLEAADGSEALERLLQGGVELVFADIHMPGMDGLELIERMAQHPSLRQVPVIVVSSDTTDPVMRKLKQLGVRAVLRKPFRPEQVRALIRNLTSEKRKDDAS
jgi:two-component system chemotaxis response regulator CheY